VPTEQPSFSEVMVNEAQEKDIDELDADYQSDDEDPTVFKIRDSLSPPAAMSYSTQVLHSASAKCATYECSLIRTSGFIHEGLIDLNPVYQRGKSAETKN
jgi:hypothetical protein